MTGPFNSDPNNPANNQPGQEFQPPQGDFPPAQQQYQQGYPQQGGYQAMPKKKKKWPWILGGIILFLIIAMGACTVFALRFAAPAIAVEEYVMELEAGDYASAYDRLCAADKSVTPESTFASQLGSAGLSDFEFIDFTSPEDGRTIVSGTAILNGVRQDVAFNMVEEEDGWKVCGIS